MIVTHDERVRDQADRTYDLGAIHDAIQASHCELKSSGDDFGHECCLASLGTASIAILLIASAQLAATLSKNAAGIDLVVGAKGSPLQLVLAGVYHADVPPGNIPLRPPSHGQTILWSPNQFRSRWAIAMGDLEL